MAYLETIQKPNHPFLDVSEVAKTIQGRPLHMLTVTEPANLERREESEDKNQETDEGVDEEVDKILDEDEDEDDVGSNTTPVVVLVSRAHAGESPTSFVVQGFVDFLLSHHEIAEDLRKHVIFKVILSRTVKQPFVLWNHFGTVSLLNQSVNLSKNGKMLLQFLNPM